MSDARDALIEWVEAKALARERLADALHLAGVTPSPAQWKSFAERLLTSLGAVLVAAAACYFVAANWHELGRFAKFALVEGAIVCALALACWRGLDSTAGRAAMVASSLLIGVLLALVGQVYQTGADTFELFAAWAICILPWVVVSREPALWVVWLALVDLAVTLYFRTNVARGIGTLDLVFMPRVALLCVLAIDAAALAAWEYLGARLGGWLAVRWAPRVVAGAIAAIATALVAVDIFDFGHSDRGPGVVAYVAFVAAMLWAYRVWRPDVVMLAGLVLSAIVVMTLLCARWLFKNDAAIGFLLTGIVVIASAVAGAYWLRKVANEARAAI